MLKTDGKVKSRIGEIIEYKAALWLAEQGYEVFQNMFYHGPIDLIIVDDNGHALLIDVKKASDHSRTKNNSKFNCINLNEKQQTMGVQVLYHDECRNFFAWSKEELYNNAGYQPQTVKTSKKQKDPLEGITLQDISDASRKFKLNPRSIRERMRIRGQTLEDAVRSLIANSRTVTVYGNVFSNRKEACKHYGVNPSSVEERMRTKDESVEQSIQHYIDKNTTKEIYEERK